MHKTEPEPIHDRIVWDFDEDLQDIAERRVEDRVRALLTGLPERPGTRR